jgi:hypothetical protein
VGRWVNGSSVMCQPIPDSLADGIAQSTGRNGNQERDPMPTHALDDCLGAMVSGYGNDEGERLSPQLLDV